MEIYRPAILRQGKAVPYAKGMAVCGAKGFVFLSGVVGEDPDTSTIPEGFGAQTTLALENIRRRLEEFGTSVENICHMWWLIVGSFPDGVIDDPRNQDRRDAEQHFWKRHCPEFVMGRTPPASTLAVVSALAKPEFLLEITVIAAIT